MVCAVLCGASARGRFSRAMEPPITAPTMPPISAMPTPSSSVGGGDRGGDSGGDKGGGGEIRTSFTGGSICSTVTASADVLRKLEAAVVSASLVATAVSAASAAASFGMLIVNATATLPAVAVASTASKGTTASSATFWRIEMSTTGVKSETDPEMVTAIFTEYDAGGGAFGGAGGGDAGDGEATVAGELAGEGGSDGGGSEGGDGDGGDGGGSDGGGSDGGDSETKPTHAGPLRLPPPAPQEMSFTVPLTVPSVDHIS